MIENLDNLVLMLTSEDIEVRKLVENYLDKNYNLNLNFYIGINSKTHKRTFELDYNKFKNKFSYYQISAKAFIDNTVNFLYLYDNEEIHNGLNLILKYNESFKQE